MLIIAKIQHESPPSGAWNYKEYDDWNDRCPRYAVVYNDQCQPVGSLKERKRNGVWVYIPYGLEHADNPESLKREFKSYEHAKKTIND